MNTTPYLGLVSPDLLLQSKFAHICNLQTPMEAPRESLPSSHTTITGSLPDKLTAHLWYTSPLLVSTRLSIGSSTELKTTLCLELLISYLTKKKKRRHYGHWWNKIISLGGILTTSSQNMCNCSNT